MNKMKSKKVLSAAWVFASLVLAAGICGGIENGDVSGWQYALVPVLLINLITAGMAEHRVFNKEKKEAL